MEASATTNTLKTELDYTPLHEPVTDEDVKTYLSEHPDVKKRSDLYQKIAYVVIAICTGLPFFNLLFSQLLVGFSPSLFFILLSLLAVAIASPWLVKKYSRYVHTYNIRINRFSVKNGVTYKEDVKNPAYTGMIFDEGDSRRIPGAYVLPGRGEVGNYHYVTGSGKNRSLHRFGYAKITLARALPHMVLDAKENNFLGLSNLPDTFDRSQTLSLEGDFDKYFTLYAPKAYERDALYIFTPDVMAQLIDGVSSFDIEIVGNELYIYSTAEITLINAANLSHFVSIVDALAAKVQGQSEYYADERVGDRSLNIISEPGAKLKKSINPIYFAIPVVIAVYITSVFIDPMLAVAIQVGGFAIIWVFVIFAIIKSVKKRQKP